MQFLVIALDGKDSDARSRREAVREAHLAGARKLKAAGHILTGGAILDHDDNMIGSALLVEFEDRDGLDAWLENDPYVTGEVWKEVTVMPFRVAV